MGHCAASHGLASLDAHPLVLVMGVATFTRVNFLHDSCSVLLREVPRVGADIVNCSPVSCLFRNFFIRLVF